MTKRCVCRKNVRFVTFAANAIGWYTLGRVFVHYDVIGTHFAFLMLHTLIILYNFCHRITYSVLISKTREVFKCVKSDAWECWHGVVQAVVCHRSILAISFWCCYAGPFVVSVPKCVFRLFYFTIWCHLVRNQLQIKIPRLRWHPFSYFFLLVFCLLYA